MVWNVKQEGPDGGEAAAHVTNPLRSSSSRRQDSAQAAHGMHSHRLRNSTSAAICSTNLPRRPTRLELLFQAHTRTLPHRPQASLD